MIRITLLHDFLCDILWHFNISTNLEISLNKFILSKNTISILIKLFKLSIQQLLLCILHNLTSNESTDSSLKIILPIEIWEVHQYFLIKITGAYIFSDPDILIAVTDGHPLTRIELQHPTDQWLSFPWNSFPIFLVELEFAFCDSP